MIDTTLLQPDEPDPVAVERPEGRSRFFITVDHGGRLLPRALGDLGVSEGERQRHIAWDIGAAGVARQLGRILDATVIRQIYSRLVCDCNRPPDAPDFAPARSEMTDIPGNRNPSSAELERRRAAVWQPYHDRIVSLLDARAAAGRATALVAMHSFTAVYKGVGRPWHIGLLYNRDRRFADALRRELEAERFEDRALVVGDNEPYRLTDETDYTIPVHGERRGLLHIEIELRQDLIAESAGQAAWAELIARLLKKAADSLA